VLSAAIFPFGLTQPRIPQRSAKGDWGPSRACDWLRLASATPTYATDTRTTTEFGSKITRAPASLTNHATKLLGYTTSQKASRNRNRSPVMMRLRLQMLAPVSVRCSCEIGERPRQPVDLIDNDNLNLAGLDVLQKPLESRPFHRPARQASVIVQSMQFCFVPFLVRPSLCRYKNPRIVNCWFEAQAQATVFRRPRPRNARWLAARAFSLPTPVPKSCSGLPAASATRAQGYRRGRGLGRAELSGRCRCRIGMPQV
jgi:hypothetical protein